MTVTSGRCVPPLNGLFSATTSPGFSVCAPVVQHGAHALAHRAEMHRHVRRVGHQEALGIEDGAGEVQPLLDVHAHRGVLQHRAGLFGDVHEQVVEQLQQHRIGPIAAGGDARRQRLGAAQHHVVERGDFRGPAGLHHGGGVGLADQRRTGDAIARQQLGAIEHRRGAILVAGEHLDRVDRLAARRSTRAASVASVHRLAGRDRLDGDRLHHQRPIRRGEAEARAMRRGEVGDDFLLAAQRQRSARPRCRHSADAGCAAR